MFLVSVILLGAGVSGIMAAFVPFAAHQVEPLGPAATKTFFSWTYWASNAGSLVSYSAVAYLQQNISFAWGLAVPLVCSSLSFLVLIALRNYLRRPEKRGNSARKFLSVLRQGLCAKLPSPETPPTQPHKTVRTSPETPPTQPHKTVRTSPETPPTQPHKTVRAGPETPPTQPHKTVRTGLLSRAKKSLGGSVPDDDVDDVKAVLRMTSVAVFMILYWVIFLQYQTTFVYQAERMDVNIGNFQIPASMLTSIDIIFILVATPVVQYLLYPGLEKLGIAMTPFRRIGLGFFFLSMTMVAAGVVEIYRKQEMHQDGGSFIQELAGENFTASTMTMLYQSPQYCLLAASEIFTAISAIEIAYTMSPDSMKTLVNGIFLSMTGIGSFLSSASFTLVAEATKNDPWFGDEINKVKMENFFFLLAGIICLNLMAFGAVTHFCHSKKSMESYKEALRDTEANGTTEDTMKPTKGDALNNVIVGNEL